LNGPSPAACALEVLRCIDVQLGGRQIRERHRVARQPAHQFPQAEVPGYIRGVCVKVPRKNERRPGMRLHAACGDLAPGAAPTRDQPRDVPMLEIDEIDRQQQDSGGMPRPAYTEANRTRKPRCSIRIRDESHGTTRETQRVPYGAARNDDDDAGGSPERQQSADRAVQNGRTVDSGERLGLTEASGESRRQHHDPQSSARKARGTHAAFHWYHGGMPRNSAQLQHKPFLMPIWLSVLAALVVMSFLGIEIWVWATADSTTIIVVRNAEKESGSADPPLSAAGQARAELLARMFGDVHAPGHIDAIYASPAVRSQMTAAPVALRLGLTPVVAPPHDARNLARRVLHEHSGARILVVGLGDTVPEIVGSLCGAKGLPPMGEAEYGTMYIVTVPRVGRADFLRLTY